MKPSKTPEARHAYYEKTKSKGLCVACGKKAEPGKTNCVECARKNCERSLNRIAALKEKGLCGCGNSLKQGSTICEKCSEQRRVKYQENKASGVCTVCGDLVEGKRALCGPCLSEKTSVKRQHIAAGLCWNGCGNVVEPDKFRCGLCRIKQIYSGLKHFAKKEGHAAPSMPLMEFVCWYADHVAKANGFCEWCSEAFGMRGPIVEHSHVTGEIRGLVCHSCNVVEGYGRKRLEKVLAKMIEWEKVDASASPMIPSSHAQMAKPMESAAA